MLASSTSRTLRSETRPGFLARCADLARVALLAAGAAGTSAIALLGACESKPTAQVAVMSRTDGTVRWVDSTKLESSPIQHETLTDLQIARISALQKTFADVDSSSLEKWLDDFKHDENVDRELSVYEDIAKAYASYTAANPLPVAARREVYSLLLVRSGTTEEETLAHTKVRILDEKRARAVLRSYMAPPHPVRVDYRPAR
jgi:hypothetical protein